jgi:hypothetical protein
METNPPMQTMQTPIMGAWSETFGYRARWNQFAKQCPLARSHFALHPMWPTHATPTGRITLAPPPVFFLPPKPIALAPPPLQSSPLASVF